MTLVTSVTLLFFSFARDRMNRDRWELEVAPGTTIETLYRDVLEPHLHAPVEQWMFSVNQVWAAKDQVLQPNDEVAVIPPVSGG